jgi:hypothetical protein
MENSKWNEDLIVHFKKHKIVSISQKVEIVTNAITEWVDFLKKNSTLNVNFTKLNSEFKIELSERLYFTPLTMEITCDDLGENIFITHNYTDTKLEQAYKKIEIEINNELIHKTLTRILISYVG